MTSQNADSSQAEVGNPAPASPDDTQLHCGNKVYKSGPLFLSSKVGIGWTSWKKRWFILTENSLVFYRSDPNVANPNPPKGGEVNLTLGGIDLNSSGSVVVKEDKKLLTVLFPDGRDGRSVTLKAETQEDLVEWKTALEEALAKAPSADPVTAQNGVSRNDQPNAVEQSKDREPAKSSVLGQPVLLALEDIDGTPSFLEKALRFLEEYGVKVEGILRQAADVENVERRIREFEHGKSEFSPDEDAHVIADCIKYILRELPSSPVPASCCNALLEAFRTERTGRVNCMRSAICETFPEPNRRLLQRILNMMQTVVSHKTENRMSTPAVAACMAPLLLRPLLAGECEIESNFEMGSDGSVQLLQAAAAANHAQAIVITLLEQYDNLFGEGSVSPELYSDSDGSGSELTDDDESYEDDSEEEGSYEDSADECDRESRATTGEIEVEVGECGDINKSSQVSKSGSESPSGNLPTSLPLHDDADGSKSVPLQSHEQNSSMQVTEQLTAEPENTSTSLKSPDVSAQSIRRPALWGRSSAKKNLSMESIDLPHDPLDDVDEIQRLEVTKSDLQNSIAEQAKGNNALLQENMENRKYVLRERRLALEKDVAQLQEQLQKELELRKRLEAGVNMSLVQSPVSDGLKAIAEDNQAEADAINLEQQKVERKSTFHGDMSNQPQQKLNDMDAHAAAPILDKSSTDKHETCDDKDKKQSDSSCSPNSSVALATQTSAEAGKAVPPSTSAKKSCPINEEHKTPAASEHQNIEKGKSG